MFRVAIVLLVTGGFAGAQPKKDEPALYYPTREGDKRVYEITPRGEKATEITQVVTKAEVKDGVVRVALGLVVGGEAHPYEEVEVSEKGVVMHVSLRQKVDPLLPLLQLPAKPGNSWEYQPKATPGREFPKTKHTVGKEEDVEVPAGKFKAIRLELDQDRKDGKNPVRQTEWHAPRVGMVKKVTVWDGGETVWALKSFTPGK